MPQEEPSPEPEPEPRGACPQQAPPADDLLRPDVLIADLLVGDPNAARVLAEEFDLPCYRCPARKVETLASGISYREVEVEQVLSRLRALRAEEGA